VARSRVKEAVNALLAARELSFVHVSGRSMLQITPVKEAVAPFVAAARGPELGTNENLRLRKTLRPKPGMGSTGPRRPSSVPHQSGKPKK
jgi:hypothetical protein